MKKKDIILVVILLAVAVIGLIVVNFMQKDEGAFVRITIDGETYGTYPLDEDRTVDIEDEYGYIRVVISGGYADVTEADCPDMICADHAPINKNMETIVCLPHKLVVEIVGGEETDIDASTR